MTFNILKHVYPPIRSEFIMTLMWMSGCVYAYTYIRVCLYLDINKLKASRVSLASVSWIQVAKKKKQKDKKRSRNNITIRSK